MAELHKLKKADVIYIIRHNRRDLPPGKTPSNESIDEALSHNNYSLIDRGQTTKEVNEYRKEIEDQCFKYHQKNIVHAVELVIQCPDDCPEDQQELFFRESLAFVSSTLPMGERCIFLAEVHRDEKHHTPDGDMISRDHMHIMYVPAIKDTKLEAFDYRLCADALTKKKNLRDFHPNLQKHLDEKGVAATVYRKKKSDGKTIGLSVKDLKKITAETGIVIKKSITVDDLAKLLQEHQELKITNKKLQEELAAAKQKIDSLQESKDVTWGNKNAWGTSTWGSQKSTW